MGSVGHHTRQPHATEKAAGRESRRAGGEGGGVVEYRRDGTRAGSVHQRAVANAETRELCYGFRSPARLLRACVTLGVYVCVCVRERVQARSVQAVRAWRAPADCSTDQDDSACCAGDGGGRGGDGADANTGVCNGVRVCR